jgi:hypothetical protein
MFPIDLILPAALGHGFTQSVREMSTRSRKIMFLGGKARPVRRAGNLAAICEPTVSRQYVILKISQPYRPSRSVTGMALPFYV